MSYLVLARKWRPKGFNDLVGQEPIMRILSNAITQGKIAHAYIFSGPRGVGKTSSARILAKALNCVEGPTPTPCDKCNSCLSVTDGSSVDVIEIDGASNNSVDDIRGLRERVKYAPSSGRYKVYIIDEVHMLSGSAFNALLKTLEEPPPHVIFVLATTEMKKIPATVLSRCQQMPFRRISTGEIRARLKYIAESEHITITPSALAMVARAADGSMRDSLTILDQISSFSSDITEEEVKDLLGITDFNMLANTAKALLEGDRAAILETVRVLTEQGTDIRTFTRELVQFFRDLLVASVVKKPEETLDLSEDELSRVREIARMSGEDQFTLMLAEIMKAESDVRFATSARLALEMALLRASFLSTMTPVKEAIERLNALHGNKDSHKKAGPHAASGGHAPKNPVHPSPVSEQPEAREIPSDPAVTEVPAVPADDPGHSGQTAGEDISHAWEKLLTQLPPPLASKLSQAHYELKGHDLLLTLNGGHAVFEDSIKESIKEIEKILSGMIGTKLRVKLATAAKKSSRKKTDLKEQVMAEPVIKEALELFEGRIVEITQTDNENNYNNGGDHV